MLWLLLGKLYFSFRETLKWSSLPFQRDLVKKAGKAEDLLRGIVTGGTLFSELGFYYIGPVDGHDIDNLVQILEKREKFRSSRPDINSRKNSKR